ncbi:hypothetical protein, partial [Streptococcus pseudopneumoniae]|uniref:hypothetical protein n=1 Tax=Streptococcus pseudopneumoniae TaxID=257758 RepID=UPI0019D4F45C
TDREARGMKNEITVQDRVTGEILRCRLVVYIDGKTYIHCPKRFILSWEKAKGIYKKLTAK